MKRICLGLILLLSCTTLIAQAQTKSKPFILRGQLSHCTETYLKLLYWDQYGHPLIDTLYLDNQGNFYYKAFNINKPQRVEIRGSKIGIKNLFAAPGYDLTLTGNGEDQQTLLETKKIRGIGSESNQYYLILDSIQNARKDEKRWLDLNENELLSYAKKTRELKDSVAKAVFDRTAKRDKYLPYFGSMVSMDNSFYQLYMLVTHVYWNDYDYNKSISYVNNNFDQKKLTAIYKDKNLNSNDYRKWLIANAWLEYLVHLDYKKDSTLRKVKDYKLKKIEDTYKGAPREFALFHIMEYNLELSSSFEDINDYKPTFETHLSKFKNKHYITALQSKYTGKVAELLRVQIGKPAPQFTLQSNQDISYSLEDFKNKVVYVDLWASWCVPCREETPWFKKLHDKYKHDQRIVFVSIAVHDELEKWKKVLVDDKPTWIQLFDKDGKVAKSYSANEIPRFVLIDKQGKIVNFDAPRPSSGQELETLLEKEIIK